jgi:D-alanyl-lipoteichoic acid acyltransferase DltB (MBOAT superfamily)
MAIGLGRMFGFEFEENFRYPYLSKSVSEFWNRWHISLGQWFRDYVYFPLGGSRVSKGKLIRNLFVVWLLTGIWHGTGINYVLWGVYWAVLMIVSSVFAPEIAKLAKLFRIDTTKESWKKFQVVRTFLLFCGGRVISTMPTPAATGEYFARIFTKPQLWQFFDGTLFAQGLSELEFAIAIVLVGLLIAVSCMQAKKSVRETIGGWNVVFRCAVYALALVLIFVFGIYGPSFNASSFAYMNF